MVDSVKTVNGIAIASLKTIQAIAKASVKTINGVALPSSGDPYWSSVVLLVANDNAADASTTFTDQSGSAHAMTAVGNAQYDTAQAPTGMTSSMLLDGTGDSITAADHADWSLGSSDWTMETMVRLRVAVSGNKAIIGQNTFSSGDGSWGWIVSNTSIFLDYTTGGTYATSGHTATFAWTPSTNTWYHFALCREGANLRAFLDGVQKGSTYNISTDSIYDGTNLLNHGNANGSEHSFDGWLSNTRITKGVARYTANFTPPSLPLPTS